MVVPALSRPVKPQLAFAAAAVVPFALLLLPGPRFEAAETILAAVGTVCVLALVALVPWEELPEAWLALPALAYLGVVALLREAAGGNAGGVGPMVLLPVIALAIHNARRALVVTVVGVALVYWLPIPLDASGDRYPSSGYRLGALFVCLSAIIGLIVESVYAQVRAQAIRLERVAHVDALTGLLNRRGWDAALRTALAVADRRGEPLCVAALDLDGFKRVNDTRGHAEGDALLTRCSSAWDTHLRSGDVLARLGGDEFGLVLPATTLAQASEIAERLRSEVTAVTCSIGVVERLDGEEGAALLERADTMLYQAKRSGRDRVVATA